MHIFFAETVIGNLDVPIKGQQDIVQFQITIDNTILVEVFKSKANFRGVKPAKKKKTISPRTPRKNSSQKHSYCARLAPKGPR